MANISDFVKAISKLDREKSAQERFRDFCEMGYCAIAKPLAPTPERAEELEARYMHIVGTYKNKDTLRAYPDLLAMVLEGVQERQDFLGIAAGELSMLDPTMGQFFTPVEVSRAMAAMMLPEDEVATLIYEKGYITVDERVQIYAEAVHYRKLLRNRGQPAERLSLDWLRDAAGLLEIEESDDGNG